jgi:hypothetical protein
MAADCAIQATFPDHGGSPLKDFVAVQQDGYSAPRAEQQKNLPGDMKHRATILVVTLLEETECAIILLRHLLLLVVTPIILTPASSSRSRSGRTQTASSYHPPAVAGESASHSSSSLVPLASCLLAPASVAFVHQIFLNFEFSSLCYYTSSSH